GARASEALAIRLKDINFTTNPTRIHIRKEYSKTKIARDVYISDEATQYVRQWLDWKYNNQERPRNAEEDDLVFTIYKSKSPHGLYFKILIEFQKLLAVVGLDKRKEDGVQKRRKITLHSFRRFVKTVISDQTNQDYSEWFLGHSKSPYYTKKEQERRQLYATKCMKYLTFLDYTTFEVAGKNLESKLQEKDREIQSIREKYEQDLKDIRDEMEGKFQILLQKIDLGKIG
ncbi:MAG TPA: site-specific integrase, partial [Nitrososphaeraceae archaeon]